MNLEITTVDYRGQEVESDGTSFYISKIAPGCVYKKEQDAKDRIDIYLDAPYILENRKKEHPIFSDSLYQINASSSEYNGKKYYIFLTFDVRTSKILTHRIFNQEQAQKLGQNIYNFLMWDLAPGRTPIPPESKRKE